MYIRSTYATVPPHPHHTVRCVHALRQAFLAQFAKNIEPRAALDMSVEWRVEWSENVKKSSACAHRTT